MKRIIKVSKNLYEMSEEVAADLSRQVNEFYRIKRKLSVAFSGGNTPSQFFSFLGNDYRTNTLWKYVDFFWSDEKCVPPDDPESNYRSVREAFFDKADIEEKNIHRIYGENNPWEEAERYSGEIKRLTSTRFGLPVFDVIYLGLGEDGHVASIFPENNHLFNSVRICEVSEHPVTHQKRITLTVPVINNAEKVIFMISGRKKAEIVYEILENQNSSDYPASKITPVFGTLYWYLDLDAASFLNQLA
ncbi:MAG TPA: 6-phosphogluconolactonase [Bacteroidales bacterium]|nr:6-phosphogluconolactonase [Bacteroidales bacterium]HOU95297.1 6-phosphogluconolactonase [Bacteroidales bacterium]HQG35633.1 6-phosphogluconolactonase [Bacteroidales bacterium]HQG51943.1 6-phosphogluconolactonase [Bacteroidales bacterium]HQJ19639.1 6-phosphogluconolactonase [Bacteroidales bacterium]